MRCVRRTKLGLICTREVGGGLMECHDVRRDPSRPSRGPNDNEEGIGKLLESSSPTMSESNNSRLEARECLRKAKRGNDSQNRWAWLVLAKTWLSLANNREEFRNGSIEK